MVPPVATTKRLQGAAWFVRRDVYNDKLCPFTDEGEINHSHTEERIVRPSPIGVGSLVHNDETGFAATASLQSYFCNVALDDDDVLRQQLDNFWKSSKGLALLQARFGQGFTDLRVFPTHVTRRRAPPDHLSLVHIDYPSSFDLNTLYQEWGSRWKDILPPDICATCKLRGVLTVWMALENVTNFPLCVGSGQKADDTVLYKVGGKRHSVGVYFDDNVSWYACPSMKPFDAWIFDTQHTPHCSIDLGGNGSRVSVEIRCLVVQSTTSTTVVSKPIGVL